MAWVHIVAMLALLEYFFFGIKVGQARGTYGVKAPATTGNEMFERFNRVHQNTLEQLIIFMPGLYAFATLISPMWAAIVGAAFVVGRGMYYNLYIGNPDKRGPGALVTMGANSVLVIGSLIAAVMALF